MNALALLKADHQNVEALFQRFEGFSPRARNGRMKVVQQVIKELSIHAAIEEQVFYPAVREALGPKGSVVLESLEEHHVVKWLLSELDGMSPEAERYCAKMKVLMETVRQHVKEEERGLFPKVRQAMDRAMLDDLGKSLTRARKIAPTHPHPRASDTPPGNVVVGVGAAVVDRVRDAGRAVVEKAAAVRNKNNHAHRNGVAPH